MLEVLINPILPVFAILALGFLFGRMAWMSVGDARVLNRFAMTVFVPILVFSLIARAPIQDYSAAPILGYIAAQGVVFAGAFLLARRVFRLDAAQSVLLGFCSVGANNVFFGLPIALLIFGQPAVLPLTSIITLDATVSFALSMAALQLITLGRAGPLSILRSLANLPVLHAIVAGTVVALLGIPIPPPIVTFLDFNGSAAAPIALFALGVVLSQTALQLDAAVAVFSVLKLVVFPAAVWAGLRIVGVAEPDAGLYLFASAGPTITMAFSLALLFDVRTEIIGQVVVWTSVFSLLSLAALA